MSAPPITPSEMVEEKHEAPVQLAASVPGLVQIERRPGAARYDAKSYVRKEYWNAPTMTLWERAYLPEIIRGLMITTGIFLKNMFRWVTGRKGALTTYYPEEKRWDFAPRNRGKHILTQRPDGSPQCIACNMCATVCPAKVIEIEAGFDIDDPAHPKFPVRFEIDYSRCVFCGLCIEACPEDAIRMEQDVPGLPSTDRFDMWLTMDEMLTWNPHQDVAKPYPPKGGVSAKRDDTTSAH
jgi:NADH-quinone oxidoreductase subunit I